MVLLVMQASMLYTYFASVSFGALGVLFRVNWPSRAIRNSCQSSHLCYQLLVSLHVMIMLPLAFAMLHVQFSHEP